MKGAGPSSTSRDLLVERLSTETGDFLLWDNATGGSKVNDAALTSTPRQLEKSKKQDDPVVKRKIFL